MGNSKSNSLKICASDISMLTNSELHMCVKHSYKCANEAHYLVRNNLIGQELPLGGLEWNGFEWAVPRVSDFFKATSDLISGGISKVEAADHDVGSSAMVIDLQAKVAAVQEKLKNVRQEMELMSKLQSVKSEMDNMINSGSQESASIRQPTISTVEDDSISNSALEVTLAEVSSLKSELQQARSIISKIVLQLEQERSLVAELKASSLQSEHTVLEAHSRLKKEMSHLSELKVEVVQTEERAMSVAERVAAQATDIAAMAFKAQISEVSNEFNTRLANATSMAQLAETQRADTEMK